MTTSAADLEARFIADALSAEADAVQRLATRVSSGGAEARAFAAQRTAHALRT